VAFNDAMTTLSPGPRAAAASAPQPATFEELAALPDEQLDVATGAALIARDAFPHLDVVQLLARFDELAAPLVTGHVADDAPRDQARRVSEHLYDTVGFRGNEADYYDPKNSLLSDVLARRLGIPITLAVVYCEIARRVGVPARGVGFPGHFLVRLDQPRLPGEPPLVIDPFFHGRVLDDEAIERLLRRALGPGEAPGVDHLAPASARAILVRMLTNLKAIYLTRGDHARALLATDRILLFSPNAPSILRERGALAARLGAHESAKADLERALELDPDGADARSLRSQLAELARKGRSLN
jgi:regulator of sirC expression with transglutaminase-like and TPR domain